MPPKVFVLTLLFIEIVSLLTTPFKKKKSLIELGLRLMAFGLCIGMLPFMGINVCLTWCAALILIIMVATRFRWFAAK